MPRGLPQIVKEHIEKCRSSATAAVDAYNRPGPRFRTAQFVILINIAWTAVFHAIFYRKGRRPWFRRPGTGVRYVRVDGEPKHWDVTECVRQYFGDKQPPERKNIEFLVGLRNKIEHRHLPELDPALYGECQASLLNLETLLVQEFGQRYALAEQLAVALQFSQILPEEKLKATKVLMSSNAQTVREYVERFRGGLPDPVLSSMKYSFSVFLVPRVANRAGMADAAVQFVKVDEASNEELSRLEKLNVLIREKHIPIANLGLFKPGEVVQQVGERIPHPMDLHAHTRAWRHYGVRPRIGDPHPERTRSEYCVYDQTHADYVYTQAWIDKLIRDLADAAEYARVVGRAPQERGAAA
jgi:desulfoferrodoxin (superoxide reductase-like protein)